MGIISTRGICEELGVSRDWVNRHLRPLGGAPAPTRRDRANVRTIFYYREDLLRWLNQNAHYSRQAYLVDLADYAKEDAIEAMYNYIDFIPDLTAEGRLLRRDVYQDFLRKHLPEEMYGKATLINERARGKIAWEPMLHHIERLDQLQTMKQLMAKWKHRSQELTYRQIFQNAMIRVEIDGRVWFMDAPEKDVKYPLLIPMEPKKPEESI